MCVPFDDETSMSIKSRNARFSFLRLLSSCLTRGKWKKWGKLLGWRLYENYKIRIFHFDSFDVSCSSGESFSSDVDEI
jgi:hypothetical protein